MVSNTNSTLFPAGSVSIGTNGTLSFTPAAGKTGSATIGVTVQDNGGIDNGHGGFGVDTSSPALTFTITVKATTKMTSVGTADLWFGTKITDDAGSKFDLLIEVLKNGTVVSSRTITGQTLGSYSSGTYRTDKAVLKRIDLSALAAPVPLGTGDNLKLRVSARFNGPPAGKPSKTGATATLWYNIPGSTSDDTSSHLHATIGGTADKYFLVTGPALKKNVAGSGGTAGIMSADASVTTTNGWQPFGTWIFIMP